MAGMYNLAGHIILSKLNSQQPSCFLFHGTPNNRRNHFSLIDSFLKIEIHSAIFSFNF
jgi:hypothetical protein